LLKSCLLRFIFVFSLLLSSVAIANVSCRIIYQSPSKTELATLEENDGSHWVALSNDNKSLALKGAEEINNFTLDIIRNAKNTIEMQTFKLSDPKWVEALLERAKEGVKIHLQISDVDHAVFNRKKYLKIQQLLQQLRNAGVVVDEFNYGVLNRKSKISSPDMHKKTVIVDQTYAYVGNKNMNSYNDSIEFGLGLQGPVVRDLRTLFYKDLANSTKDIQYLDELATLSASSDLQIFNSYELKSHLIESIRSAKKRIVLGQVEFNDKDILEALINKRITSPEVRIQIFTAKIEKEYSIGGLGLKKPFNANVIEPLIQSGVEIVVVDDSNENFFHGKITVLDDEKVIIGSSDYNLRSFTGNAELDLEVASRELALEFENYLDQTTLQDQSGLRFTRTQKIISRYFEWATGVLSQIHRIKAQTFNKYEFNAEYLKLILRRRMGDIFRFLISIGQKNYQPSFPKSLENILERFKGQILEDEIIHDEPLKDGEFYAFVGVSTYAAEKTKKFTIEKTLNGKFGDGYYFATSIDSAITYSAIRNQQTYGEAKQYDILVFRIHASALGKSDSLQNGAADDAFIIEAADGPGRDYVVLKNQSQFQLVGHLKIAKDAKGTR
jgi:phosphatidylserine/phosphatidylglycerophosphate/cardiolipin synthase-like enzyme